MDRNTVIETAYETIKESLEWTENYKENEYATYIEGIVTVTDAMLEKLNQGRPCASNE